MSAYPYGTGNRLEDRNTYFYSPYVGRDLFICWKRQRDDALREPPNSPFSPSEETPSEQLIASLFFSLAQGVARSDEWLQINKLLQRFEVTKRLHSEYNSNWRPVDPSDYQSMEAYLRFAELMDLAYQSNAKLQYLNALLKSMDTLTALAGRIDVEQMNRLVQLIGHEREHIEKLALKIGIPLTESLE